MNAQTLLYRQVNPAWIQEGRVTSQAFQPTPKDNKRLSVYDGDQISPEAAWRHFTRTLGFESVGILAVTVLECDVQDLEVYSDPAPFREHAIIDFGELSENQIKSKAKLLRALANSRSWLFQAPPSPRGE